MFFFLVVHYFIYKLTQNCDAQDILGAGNCNLGEEHAVLIVQGICNVPSIPLHEKEQPKFLHASYATNMEEVCGSISLSLIFLFFFFNGWWCFFFATSSWASMKSTRKTKSKKYCAHFLT